MIKLKLDKDSANLESVRELPGLLGVHLDESYGVILINPAQSQYVVRADEIDNLDTRKKISPEILDAYGDIRISGFE